MKACLRTNWTCLRVESQVKAAFLELLPSSPSTLLSISLSCVAGSSTAVSALALHRLLSTSTLHFPKQPLGTNTNIKTHTILYYCCLSHQSIIDVSLFAIVMPSYRHKCAHICIQHPVLTYMHNHTQTHCAHVHVQSCLCLPVVSRSIYAQIHIDTMWICRLSTASVQICIHY